METYIRLIAVLIVGCRGVNIPFEGKTDKIRSTKLHLFLKKGKLIIREGFGGLPKALF